jgi:hypothetical protein
MKRLVIIAILKLCGEAILLAILVGIVIAIIGNLNKWDTPIQYSNAFFIAGCLVIVPGVMSRLRAGEEWYYFQSYSAESIRDMSPDERASFVVNTSTSLRHIILGLLTGILLILTSVLVMKLFS